MTAQARRRTAMFAAAAAALCSVSAQAQPQACPAVLSDARRLVLVTAKGFNDTQAEMRLYERPSRAAPWRAFGPAEPALIGKGGMAWSYFFRSHARPGEPVKVDGDKRAPAGIYPIGRSFGTVPSNRPGHLQVTEDTVCVDEPSSPHYNTIISRRLVGAKVSAENMSRALPMYRRGLVIDYPTDGKARAGSCIFIHVWRSPTVGTAGCVAVPEPRVEALQDFAAGGAALAILPRAALGRLAGCLPKL